MKKILLLLLLFPMVTLRAQDVKVSLSSPFEVKDGDDFFKIGDAFYKMEIDNDLPRNDIASKLMKSAHSITLYKYDNAMNEVKKNELEEGKKNFEPFLPKMFDFDNKVLLVYYRFYKGEDSARLFLSQVDPETLETTNTKELFSFSQKKASAFKAYAYQEDDYHLFVSLSPDKNKILVAHTNNVQISSCVIDKNLDITENTFSKCLNIKNFIGRNAFIDNSGNKYISYHTGTDDNPRNGLFVQNVFGKEIFTVFNTGDPMYNAGLLNIKNSKDNSKIYVYGAYSTDRMYEDQGILLSTIEATGLKINTPQLFPFSDDFKQRMYDLKFGNKHKGIYSPVNTLFTLRELDNGTLAFLGTPKKAFGPNFVNYYGPIVSVFINNGKISTALIPRMQGGTDASASLFVTNKNNIVCIYTDDEKNLTVDINTSVNAVSFDKLFGLPENFILATAIIDVNNTVISRKKIADDKLKNYYFLDEAYQLEDNSFIMPIGHTKATLSTAYDELTQWVNLEIQ
jgi:hypothetical protein